MESHILAFPPPADLSRTLEAVVDGRLVYVTLCITTPDDPLGVAPIAPGGWPFRIEVTSGESGEACWASPHRCDASGASASPPVPLVRGG